MEDPFLAQKRNEYRVPSFCYIPYGPVASYLACLKGQLKVLVFHSNETGKGLSRYSYIAWHVAESFILNEIHQAEHFFECLKQKQKDHTLKSIPILPPFQGGFAGVIGYDVASMTEPFERHLPLLSHPLAEVNMYAMVLAFDHVTKEACLISTGWPADTEKLRELHAKASLAEWRDFLKLTAYAAHTLLQYEIPFSPMIYKRDYLNKIRAIQECIRNGEIFEVNLANCFYANIPKHFNLQAFYLSLGKHLKEDFGAYFEGTGYTILSYSPERFLKVSKGMLEARPIKGTIKKELDPVKDFLAQQTLLNSIKDKAENTMIVDLMRNDFSKICEDDSIQVTQLCGLETKAAVHHLVSVIQGKLRQNKTIWDAFLALFPAGSITGAPKRQSMKVIDRFEVISRGFYCGNLFYLSHADEFDSSILIRSLFVTEDEIRCYSGGAITLLSDAEAEWAEIQAKISRFLG